MACDSGIRNRTRRVIKPSKLGHQCPALLEEEECNVEACICGDSVLEGRETCDDGNDWPGI